MNRLLRVPPPALLAALAVAATAPASPPNQSPFFDEFVDVNPCTGLEHTVTISGAVSAHEHGERLHGHNRRTITTSSGFSGRGVDSVVANGQTMKFSLNDVLTNDSGDRIRAHAIIVFDVSSGAVRVEKGGVRCLTP